MAYAIFIIYKLAIYITTSLFYLFLAINTIYTKNLKQIKDLLFFV